MARESFFPNRCLCFGYSSMLVTYATLVLLGCRAEPNLVVKSPHEQCPSSCSLPPNERKSYDKATGFTDNTGYHGSGCCDICLPGTKTVNCNTHIEPECANKTGKYDWDTVTMDHIWAPQFCAAIAQGHDPTLTNIANSTCATVPENLLVHGLWPSYVAGFPQCCGGQPLDPVVSASWSIASNMSDRWADPAVPSSCSTCFNWNHEWQKHGACFAATPEDYFGTTLEIDARLFDSLARFKAAILRGERDIDKLQEAYSMKKIQILCDPKDPMASKELGVLLEVRSCWQRRHGVNPGTPTVFSDLEPVNCPPAFSSGFSAACPSQVYARTSKSLVELLV